MKKEEALRAKLTKILKASFPGAFFWVEVGHGGKSVSIRTSLLKMSRRKRRAIFYLERKFREEGLDEAEFEALIYLKELFKRDAMVRRELRRMLLQRGVFSGFEVKRLEIEGFDTISWFLDFS
jgi:hypothetical protein